MDKYTAVTGFQRHVVNPVVRQILQRWRLPGHALLETTGHKSGQMRYTPVGDGFRGDTFWIVAEHGHRAAYVRNIKAQPRVRVKARGQWRSGTAHVLPDDDPVERQRQLGTDLTRRLNDVMVRATGTELLTIRVDLDSAD